MSPRKRIRTSVSDIASQGAKAAGTAELDNAWASAVMAKSSDGFAGPSAAEGSSNARRRVSLGDAKFGPRGWYGSWPRTGKSGASTQLATETILGGTVNPRSLPDFSRYDIRKATLNTDEAGAGGPSRMHQSAELPPRVSPLAVSPVRVDSAVSRPESLPIPVSAATTLADAKIVDRPDTVTKTGTSASQGAEGNPSTPAAAPASGWFSWLGRPAHVEASLAIPAPVPAPELAVSAPASLPKEDEERQPPEPLESAQSEAPKPAVVDRSVAGRVWSYMWYGNAPASSATTQPEAQSSEDAAVPETIADGGARDVTMEDAPSAPIPVPAASTVPNNGQGDGAGTPGSMAPVAASSGSTWAFWSRDARTKVAGKTSSSLEQGEIAVIGERSEADPKPASGVEVRRPSIAPSLKDASTRDTIMPRDTSKKGKRLRPLSMDVSDEMSSGSSTPRPEASLRGEPSSSKQTTAGKQPQARLLPSANLLLPSFQNTYHLKQNTSIVRQVTRFLMRAHQPPATHVYLTTDLPKIKKAVAIGVHGLFPAAYLRPVIGQPTGTSIRFANHGAEAVRRWADAHGCRDCEIEKIALEGEGKIADRVDNLWKLLLNWVDHIRSADVVILACHSQGVPVGIMLLAKLIELGMITTARVGVCAMAGVSLGPFPDYKAGLGILMGSAGELWDFANPESEISKRYEHSLKTVLEYGARVTYVGSIDDQVVPLESALYSPAHHPYLYRAVFVDGRIHAPDFIASLVGFACKLRNLGISDHGLIRELSVPLAGSLYSGEGHSRVYDDPQVYDLAASHALETADVGTISCEVRERGSLTNPNPYHLPWMMRGMLEEDFVKTELSVETAELLKQFDEWKPVTKALKDVKYRLEAVRSKL